MSLSARIAAIVLLFSLALALAIGQQAHQAWVAFGLAQHSRGLNLTSEHLLRGAVALAAERGATNGLLANPAAATPAGWQRARASRAEAEAALAAAMPALAAAMPALVALAPGQPAVAVALTRLQQATDRVQALRQAADAGGAGSPAPGVWFAATSARIEALMSLRRAAEAAGEATSEARSLVALRDALAELAEFAGQERGLLNGMIQAGRAPAGAQLMALGSVRGRVEGAWARIEAVLADAPPAVVAAVETAREGYLRRFEAAARGPVLAAASSGGAWPMDGNAWFTAATGAMETVVGAGRTVGEAADAALAREAAARRRLMLLLAGGAALVLVLAALTQWSLRRAVIRPLRGAIQALRRLAAGELDATVPPPRGASEVAELLQATLHFQAAAQANLALQQDRDSLAAKAVAARDEGEREMVTLLEAESTRLVENVGQHMRGLFDQCQQMESLAGETLGLTQGVANEAGRSLAAANAVADEANALPEQINQIARDMVRAGSATRDAVAKTEAARRTFDVLAASVGEIGEVTRLIADIAQRTNLLALNATIEAARAGEAGKGFAVVASEVKALAGQTARSTEEIGRRIAAIDATAKEAVGAMADIGAAVSALDEVAASVAGATERQGSATASIAHSVAEAAQAARGVSTRIGEVSQVVGHNGVAAASLRASGEHVSREVAALKGRLVQLMRTRSSAVDRRGEPRLEVDLPANVEHGDGRSAGRLRDISLGGANFIGEVPTMHEAMVELPGHGRFPARVVAQPPGELHLAWREPLPAAVLAGLDAKRQRAA